jgi:hypothetical protein
MKMIVDEVTACRLHCQAKAGVPHTLGKESTFYEEIDTEILGVPCVVRFGFTSRKKCSTPCVTTSCVWIFGSSDQAFLGAIYLPIEEDAHAPSILNSTIDRAIKQAILNPKFAALNASGISQSTKLNNTAAS